MNETEKIRRLEDFISVLSYQCNYLMGVTNLLLGCTIKNNPNTLVGEKGEIIEGLIDAKQSKEMLVAFFDKYPDPQWNPDGEPLKPWDGIGNAPGDQT